jgi:hypothetical protein
MEIRVRKGGLQGGGRWWAGGTATAGRGRWRRRRGWCWRRKKIEVIIGANGLYRFITYFHKT